MMPLQPGVSSFFHSVSPRPRLFTGKSISSASSVSPISIYLARETSFCGNCLIIGRWYVIRIRIDLEGWHVADIFVVASLRQGINRRQTVTLSYSLITGGTAANKPADSVWSASEGTRAAETSGTYLHADCQIIIELITVRTTAFVTTNRVNAGTIATWRRVAFILVNTLIIIKVLHKAIRASTAVTSHKILATVFTIDIVGTFIMICTETPRMV